MVNQQIQTQPQPKMTFIPYTPGPPLFFSARRDRWVGSSAKVLNARYADFEKQGGQSLGRGIGHGVFSHLTQWLNICQLPAASR